MKKTRNNMDEWDSKKFRNLNDIKLAKQYYQYQIELQENALIYEFKEVRQSFAESVKNSLRKFGTQLMIASSMKLLKTYLTRKRK